MHARDRAKDEPARRGRARPDAPAGRGLASALGNGTVSRLVAAGALAGPGGLDLALARALRKPGPDADEPLARGPVGPPEEAVAQQAGEPG